MSKKRTISVSSVLKYLGVSKSGYYDWKKREDSKQKIRKYKVQARILFHYEESMRIYGAPKIAVLLRREGEVISTKTVGNYMREMGIMARWIRPYTITTIDSDFSEELQNILKRDFSPLAPDKVWVTDITYIWTLEGFVYLSSIMDVYSRKIVAWKLSDTLELPFVLETVQEAMEQQNIKEPLIIHSDRGVHYTSNQYRKVTENLVRSYSRKGNPWDNACIESFHALIKREYLNFYVIQDLKHVHQLVFEYINSFYNTVRIHEACGYESPLVYESNYQRIN